MTSQPGMGVAAGRPQPQTTVEAPGGPFIRHTQAGRRTQYSVSSVAFGGLVAQPLAGGFEAGGDRPGGCTELHGSSFAVADQRAGSGQWLDPVIVDILCTRDLL